MCIGKIKRGLLAAAKSAETWNFERFKCKTHWAQHHGTIIFDKDVDEVNWKKYKTG